MGLQRSEFERINIVENVTHSTGSAVQGNSTVQTDSDVAQEYETIDITIDEDDHKKMFGSPSTVPLQLPPGSATQSSIAQTSAAWGPPPPPPSYDQVVQAPSDAMLSGPAESSPDRSYHFRLPTALHESGLLFNPQFSLSNINIVHVASPEAQASAAAGPATVPPTPATVTTETAPTPSLAAINACKPHPSACFVAETLEWRLILDQSQLSRSSPLNRPLHDATHIYDACHLPPGSVPMYETEPTSVPVSDQRNPVHLFGRWDPAKPDTSLPVLEDFNCHICYLSGKHLLSSPPDSIVSVVDRQLLIRFKENRENDPTVGLTGPEHFVRALRVLLRVIGNFIHGERRGAPTTSATLTQKLGWDELSRQIFLSLGWKESKMPDGRNAILPPSTSLAPVEDAPADLGSNGLSADPSGLHVMLQRNIRAWMELSVWLAFHVEELRKKRPTSSLIHSTEPNLPTRIVVDSASESVLEMIGLRREHLDSSYRKDLPANTLEAFFTIGASSTDRDELVKFAYLINMEANQGRRACELFASLDEIYTTQRRTSRVLEELLAYERSQGRFSPRDLDKSYERLHLSAAHLGSDVERENIPLELIVDNYKARAREVLINGDASEHGAVKEALKMIAQHLGKPKRLVQALDEDVEMDIEQAYRMLDANPELDDSTLLVVFDLYVADAPARRDLLRHALRSIAEYRKSEYLRHFLRTGEKDTTGAESWQQLPSNDIPAGIDNIGNTCYLNSVLQYFFSITEVRTRVLQAAAHVQAGAGLPDQADAEHPQTDTGRRVGGQRITARELERSRRFVAQLDELFRQLIHANALSVRPERELAYLALVSSRAEELEGELNSTVEKYNDDQKMADLLGSQDPSIASSDPATIEEVVSAPAPATAASSAATSNLMDTTSDEPAITQPNVPGSARPPPLPPRPARKMTSATHAAISAPARRNSLMQLGAQQDVSECLDNCMFQLEVALSVSKDAAPNTKSSDHNMEIDDSEASPSPSYNAQAGDENSEDLLTCLFLGKTCQRIEADTMATASSTGNPSDGDISDMLTRPPQPHKQPSTHIKHEVFKILPIDVLEEGRDVYDGFDGFFDSDTFVATSGAVQRRSVTLLSAPPLLQIQLQRVQYDRVTMRAFKSQAHLDMPEMLYMDRYMDLDPSDGENVARIVKRLDYQAKRRRIDELRTKLAACKDGATFHLTQTLSQAANAVAELAKLPSLSDISAQLDEVRAEGEQAETIDPEQVASGTEVTDATAPTIASGDALSSNVTAASTAASDEQFPPALSNLIDPGLQTLLRDEAALLREQVKQVKEEIESLKSEMASIWVDERRFAYRLVAVFMHRGEASHGHYFLNLRGGSQDSKWFKYNDSAVTETSLDQVLRDRSGATPYLVTYVREDYVRLIDPICRMIEVGQEQEQSWMEVEGSTMREEVSGWEPSKERDAGDVKPTIVTDAFHQSRGETGSGNESPIKRARTDDL